MRLEQTQPADLLIKLSNWLCIALLSLFACLLSGSTRAVADDLWSELPNRGLPFTEDQRFPIPPLALSAELLPAQRLQVARQLAGKQDWRRFLGGSTSAPVTVEIEAIESPAGEKLGLSLHSAFIAQAQLSQLSDTQVMQQIFGPPPQAADAGVGIVMQTLSEQQLRDSGFAEQAASSARFAYVELPLLNKVLIAGVIRVEQRQFPDAYEFAWQLDPAFNRHPPYMCRWVELERNPVGRLVTGQAHPYQGCGGLIGVYELPAEGEQALAAAGDRFPGGVLVESRWIIHEPQAWFAGSHFLRSKLPSAMQENARSFRRKLAGAGHDSADR